MEFNQILTSADDVDGTLDVRRKKFLVLLTLGLFSFLLPFITTHLMVGNFALVAASMLFLCFLSVNVWKVSHDQQGPIAYPYVMVSLAVMIFCTTYVQGLQGVLWSYPAIIGSYFMVPRIAAHFWATIITLSLTVLLWVKIDPWLAVRVWISLLLTIFIVTHILNTTSELQARLLHQAVRDPLTGVFNRREMDEHLKEAHARFQRKQDPVALLVIDIDDFKLVNDQYGHAAGDDILQLFAQVVQENTREIDLLFRLGGDEFTLLLWDTDADSALSVAEELRRKIEETRFSIGRLVTVSIGLNTLKQDQSISVWFREADEALYRVKNNGRNRVCLHQANLAETS